MALLKFIQLTTFAWFAPDDGSAFSRTAKGSFTDAHKLGNAVSVEYNTDPGNEVLQVPGAHGRFVDHTVFATQDTETFTLNVNQLTEPFFKMLRRANYPIVAGAVTFKPGYATGATPSSPLAVIGQGWLRIEHKNQHGVLIERLDRFVYLEVPRQNVAKGVANVAFNGRRLDSTLHVGDWYALTGSD